jgi:hypothetical protein
MVFVKSKAYPADIRVIKPDRIEIRLAMDDIRNKNEQEFVRSFLSDKTIQLRIFLRTPTTKINIEN